MTNFQSPNLGCVIDAKYVCLLVRLHLIQWLGRAIDNLAF